MSRMYSNQMHGQDPEFSLMLLRIDMEPGEIRECSPRSMGSDSLEEGVWRIFSRKCPPSLPMQTAPQPPGPVLYKYGEMSGRFQGRREKQES